MLGCGSGEDGGVWMGRIGGLGLENGRAVEVDCACYCEENVVKFPFLLAR